MSKDDPDFNERFYGEVKLALNDMDATTSWGEFRANGVDLGEAASSTFPVNDRYLWKRDGSVLNRNEVDNLVTHVPPLYEFDVQPGETIIVRGKDRNAYIPGFDSVAAIASEFSDDGPEGQYCPDGIEIATGYSVLDEGSEEGFPLVIKPDDVIAAIFKNGVKQPESKSLEAGEWDFNPWASEKYDFDITKFAVKRDEFDLYGAGDNTKFMKIRDTDGFSEYLECVTTGIVEDPLLAQYNLPNSLRVSADGSRSSPYTVRVGPLDFFNRTSASPPARSKKSTVVEASPQFSIGADDHTVLGVYRLKSDYLEVPTSINELEVTAGTEDCRIEVREVLPEFLTRLPADSNWISPGTQNPAETAVEGVEAGTEGQFNVGDVTIATFTTDKGKTIPRGRQIEVVRAQGGQGNRSGEFTSEELTEQMSELKYIALLGQVDNPPASVKWITAEFDQRF